MIKVSSNAKQVASAIDSIPEEITHSLSDQLVKFMNKFRLSFIRTRMSGRPGINRGTGKLQRSFKVNKTARGTSVLVNLDSDSELAATHEYGDTIRGNPYLAIPLTEQYKDIGQAPDGFFFVSKKGNLLYGTTVGRQLVPLFVLKESVDIPARLGLRRMFASERDETVDFVTEVIGKVMNKAVRTIK